MKLIQKLKEVVTHPYSVGTSVFGAVGGLLNPDVALAFLGALYSAAPTLFTGASISAFTLPRVFPSLALLKPVFLAILAIAGPLYLLRIVHNSTEIFENRL